MYNKRTLSLEEHERLYYNYVNEKLKQAEEWAATPDAKWLPHEEVMKSIKGKYGI